MKDTTFVNPDKKLEEVIRGIQYVRKARHVITCDDSIQLMHDAALLFRMKYKRDNVCFDVDNDELKGVYLDSDCPYVFRISEIRFSGNTDPDEFYLVADGSYFTVEDHDFLKNTTINPEDIAASIINQITSHPFEP